MSTAAATNAPASSAGLRANTTTTNASPRSSHNRLASSGRTHRSSESSTSMVNQRTLNFFRKIVGQRNDDYHSDAPQVNTSNTNVDGVSQRSLGSRGASGRSRQHFGGDAHATQDGTGCCACCGGGGGYGCRSWWPMEQRHLALGGIIYSRWWKVLLVFFTFVLLFGAQIRWLWIPKAGDTAMDAIFMTAFVFFTIDIFIRIDIEPNYFGLRLWCLRYKQSSNNPNPIDGGSCRVGSFLFWCDVVSTSTLLYEISFIFKRNFEEQKIAIGLDPFGIPQDGLESVNAASPVETEIALLVTICKTARVARFIRSSTAVKISSKVNWYRFFNLFNPCWWWETCCSPNAARLVTTVPETTYHSSSMGLSERSDKRSMPSRSDLVRRQSWGGVGLGALATVKAKQSSEESFRHGAFRSIKTRALKFLGLLRHDNEEWRRQLAATKIQRAWRCFAHQAEYGSYYDDDDRSVSDDAWKGRPSTTNPMEKALQKRSFLMRYSTMNVHNIRRSNRDSTGRSGNEEGGIREVGSGRSRVAVGSSQPTQRRSESQVGSAMRELTGQRVALGIIIALVLTVLFTYTEEDATRPSTMIVLHNQTANEQFANMSLAAARASSVPDLYEYVFANGRVQTFELTNGEDPSDLRDRERLRISIVGAAQNVTTGFFAQRDERREEALVNLLSTIFILFVWFFGVTAFAGPVMVLVVIPIERMVRLLGMLMLDPLGYQGTSRYKRFVAEEDEITKNTRWTKEILKGMETSFLMSTILRIGSLMKVGFGSAGVEIIRKNLERGQSKNMLILSSQGSTVSCIFLFCDIRQFTDATECLQEEVFVFTNRIAAVVHSICHSYGGSANKNVGDAFLLSWLLEEEVNSIASGDGFRRSTRANADTFIAKHNQADKALLSVVKICMALMHDDYYIEPMTDGARDALLAKLAKREGPVVQMGFGLHAGKAVQGAIGSQRKIDATYVSEAVERAEFLESSTKKYGVKMLMSDSFHRLLHPSNRRRCRKIDQILIRNEDDDTEDDYLNGDIMELLTFDMDIEALWKNNNKGAKSDTGHESDSESTKDVGIPRMPSSTRQTSGLLKGSRRRSLRFKGDGSDELPSDQAFGTTAGNRQPDLTEATNNRHRELVLPTGPAFYNANVWVSEDMRRIRQLYSDGLFFQTFNSGLQSFYAKDWEHAKQCFVTILDRFEDGPSRYFLNQIEKYNGKPPRDFLPYGIA